MEILVFGAGSLGSLVGGLLARAHDVTLVGRDPHMRTVREEGLRVEGAIEAHTNPRAVTEETGLNSEVAVVTTKTYDTKATGRALAAGDHDTVVSLQNGLTEEWLDAALDARVLAGTVTYGARLHEPGRVECTGEGEIVVGALGGGTDSAAERVGATFREAGLNATVAEDMPLRRWEKLAINAGINAPTALARVTNGALADGPAVDTAIEAATETAAVARAEGISLPNTDAITALERVVDDTAANHSSMRQDLDAGRRTEIDAINGAVVDRAAEHDVDVPTNAVLTDLVRAWEAERSLRPTEKGAVTSSD